MLQKKERDSVGTKIINCFVDITGEDGDAIFWVDRFKLKNYNFHELPFVNKYVRDSVMKYCEENKEGISESHLMGWFDKMYKSRSKEYIRTKLEIEHDWSIELENAEEELGEMNDSEKEYLISVAVSEILSNLKFSGASAWRDTTGEWN